MPDLSFKIEGLEALLAKLKPELVAGPVKKFLMDASLYVEGQAKRRTPVDTGRLRASITHEIDASPMPLFGKIGTNVFYAPYVEFGTRPHFPPPGALDVWASRHGFPNGFVVARAISRAGTRGRHMFEQGLEASKGKIGELLDVCATAIMTRWKS